MHGDEASIKVAFFLKIRPHALFTSTYMDKGTSTSLECERRRSAYFAEIKARPFSPRSLL
jgi:hypothetical protein